MIQSGALAQPGQADMWYLKQAVALSWSEFNLYLSWPSRRCDNLYDVICNCVGCSVPKPRFPRKCWRARRQEALLVTPSYRYHHHCCRARRDFINERSSRVQSSSDSKAPHPHSCNRYPYFFIFVSQYLICVWLGWLINLANWLMSYCAPRDNSEVKVLQCCMTAVPGAGPRPSPGPGHCFLAKSKLWKFSE